MLYYSLASEERDPYLLSTVLALPSEQAVQGLTEAIRVTIARHDIFRTSVHWCGLSEPVQAVWHSAPRPLKKVELAPEDGPLARRLLARFGSRQCRGELAQAPLMRLATQSWLVLWQRHHLIIDHISDTPGTWNWAISWRDAAPARRRPYRNFVAQARLGLSAQEHRQFLRSMLGDVDAATLPYNATAVQGRRRNGRWARWPSCIWPGRA